MVVMIAAICLEDAVMASIAPTASFTTVPPCSAESRALTAIWFACRALSAFCLTVEVISSRAAAVSSREEACSWAPEESCPLPAASCWAADAVCCAACLNLADGRGELFHHSVQRLPHLS